MEKIIGTYGFTNDSGIAVVGVEHGVDDVVLYRYVNGEQRSRLCRSRVRNIFRRVPVESISMRL